MLKLGSITLEVPFFQASLSGYSDYAMRRLAMDYGSPLVFAGVMLAKSVNHPKIISKRTFRPEEDEHPIGAQLLGDEPQAMADAARVLVGAGYDLIDLNFACPAPKVLRRRRGGFLLNKPQTVMEIYRKVRESVNCPVLMKLRTGFDNDSAGAENFWDICRQASADGIDAIIVHPRTVLQKFKGTADRRVLGELKRQFPRTTIIGSGDLFSAASAVELLKTSGIDGVVIARGAVGNPWIFRELRAALEGMPLPGPPDLEEQGRVVLAHFEMLCGLYQAGKAVGHFRKFIVNYCKFHPQRKAARIALLAANDRNQMLAAIELWYGVKAFN